MRSFKEIVHELEWLAEHSILSEPTKSLFRDAVAMLKEHCVGPSKSQLAVAHYDLAIGEIDRRLQVLKQTIEVWGGAVGDNEDDHDRGVRKALVSFKKWLTTQREGLLG